MDKWSYSFLSKLVIKLKKLNVKTFIFLPNLFFGDARLPQ